MVKARCLKGIDRFVKGLSFVIFFLCVNNNYSIIS